VSVGQSAFNTKEHLKAGLALMGSSLEKTNDATHRLSPLGAGFRTYDQRWVNADRDFVAVWKAVHI